MNATQQSPKLSVLLFDIVAMLCLGAELGLLLLAQLAEWPGLLVNLQAGSEMQVYLGQARGLLDGSWPGFEPFAGAPLYPFVLAPLMLSSLKFIAVCWLQTLIFALSAVLVMLTARQLAGRVAGWFAGLGLLLYGGAFFWVMVLHSVVVELFLVSAFSYLLVLWQQRLRKQRRTLGDLVQGQLGGKAAIQLAVLTAVAYVLLCLAQPTFLVLAPLLVLGLLSETGSARQFRQIFIQGLFAIVVGVVLLAPVVIRNNYFSDKLMFLRTNTMANYAVANSEDSVVFGRIKPQKPVMSPHQFRFWGHQLKKAVGYWRNEEYPQTVNYYLFREQSLLLRFLTLPFGLIAALFLMGIFLLRREPRKYWPCLVVFGGYYLGTVLFFIVGRVRIPGLPMMLVVGSAGLVKLWEGRKAAPRRFVAALVLIVLLALASFSCSLRTFPQFAVHTPDSLYATGVCAMYRQQPELAEDYFGRAHKLEPSQDNGVKLATALTQLGRHAEALNVLRELRRQHPDKPDLAETEAAILERLGPPERAAEARKQLREQFPQAKAKDLISRELKRFRQQQHKYDLRRPLRALARPE